LQKNDSIKIRFYFLKKFYFYNLKWINIFRISWGGRIKEDITLKDWIRNEAVSFSVDSLESLNNTIDKLMDLIDDSVELLGFGEALHGSEEILNLRNQIFYRLVERYGYSAVAIESSFINGKIINEYVNGRITATYEELREIGFSHGFGRLNANMEIVEWIRKYNMNPKNHVKVQFYGFDSPTEMTSTDSPRKTINYVLDYLTLFDGEKVQKRRNYIESLIGEDFDWENFDALMDPKKSIGKSEKAVSLRIEVEEIINELKIRRPEFVKTGTEERYLETLHYAITARQLLNYHSVMAKNSEKRVSELLGIRDVIMADNLEYIASCERKRGKIFVFAHNEHLKRGNVKWQLGSTLNIWWPAGSHLNEVFGSRYAVIGSGIGISELNGIEKPENGTLEELFLNWGEQLLFIQTNNITKIPTFEIDSLKTRSKSTKNSTYFPFTPESLFDFDVLLFLNLK